MAKLKKKKIKFKERNSLKSKTTAWVSDIESVVGSRT